MGATVKNRGVEYGTEERLAVAEVVSRLLACICREGVPPSWLSEFHKAAKAANEGVPFEVAIQQPKTFAQFLALQSPTQGLFNQLASEVPFYLLLDQIEEAVHGPDAVKGTGQSFFVDLWEDEVANDPFKPRANWKYLPIEEAVEAFRKIFGSGLNADMLLAQARQATARQDSEGIAVWLKLSSLAKLSGVTGDPLAATDEGRAAYARSIELFIPQVGRAFTKAYPNFGFQNYHQGALTSSQIVLTPAGRASWQRLESATSGDFCFSPAGANTGNVYAGHSVRRSRIRVATDRTKLPQDCIMVGQTIATQPDRLTAFEHLGIDCIGNGYSPDADGQFAFCVIWIFDVGKLEFGSRWTVGGNRLLGGASVSVA